MYHNGTYIMPAGRPTKYEGEETCRIAYEACLLGATDQELSKIFDVSRSTIDLWKNEHQEFSDILNKAKEDADARVEKSLYQRANGFLGKQVKVTSDGAIIEHDMHYPPDPTSMIFWLKNRQRAKWSDRITQEHEGTLSHSFVTDKPLSAKEFEEQIAPKPDEDE